MYGTQKVHMPRFHKGSFQNKSRMSADDIAKARKFADWNKTKEVISSVFKLDSSNDRDDILIDMLYYSYQFSVESDFTNEQAAALMEILMKVHEIATETSFGNLDQTYQHFRELVVSYSVQRPPFSVQVFGDDEVLKVTQYVLDTYMRLYKWYKYVFTPQMKLNLEIDYPCIPEIPLIVEGGCADDAQPTADGAAQPGGQDGGPENRPVSIVEPAEYHELRGIIRKHIEEELKTIKASIEEKMKESEVHLSSASAGERRSARSARSAKKK